MAFMFREFRAREANPEGWDIKMRQWTQLIEKWSAQSGVSEFTINDVRNAFRTNDQVPDAKCIKLVLSNMHRKGHLLNQNEFKTRCSQKTNKDGWLSWGLSTAAKPISWGISMLGSSAHHDPAEEQISDAIKDNATFVNYKYVQEAAHKFFRDMSSSASTFYRYDDLVKKVKGTSNLQEKTIDNILAVLESESRVCVTVDCGIKIVKFGTSFSEVELGVVRLESAKELVEAEIKKIETEMETLRDEAKVAVREKNNLKAKHLLKRKKRLEMQISSKEGQLDNIEFLLEQLAQADSQKMVLDAYTQGADMLKSAQREHLDLDDTIADIEDALQLQNDMIADLARPLHPVTADEKELDDELNALLEDVEEEPSTPVKATSTPRPAKSQPVKETSAPSSVKDGVEQTQDLDDLMARLERLRAPADSPVKDNGDDRQKDKPSALRN